jgi:hypothetical protein
MRKFTAFRAIAVAGAMLAAAVSAFPAMAADPVTSGSTLTGATGVNVGGNLYNVQFLDGSCATVFGSCPGGFAFGSQAAAQQAADALLAQVLLGTFDTNPARTNGCSLATICSILVPYAVDGQAVAFVSANNKATNDTGTGSLTLTDDTGIQASQTWARFTRSTAPVPEPASWAMMLLGFAGIGLAARRRRSAWLTAA